MKTPFLFLLGCFLSIIACDTTPNTPHKPTSVNINIDKLPLVANVSNLRIRSQPGLEGSIVSQVLLNDTLYYLENISNFTTKITLRGKEYNEPWLKVRLKNGDEGWVYAGSVDFEKNEQGILLAEQLLNKRLYSFFGKNLGQDIERLEKEFQTAELSSEMAAVYTKYATVKDSINSYFENYFEKYDYDKPMPNLYWIGDAIDGLVASRVAEGTSYYLFYNYKNWDSKAASTIGTEDDQFFDLCYSIYATDSIEYFFKNWTLQVSDYESSSLLGEGKHLAILNKMETLSEETKKLFNKPIDNFKTELLNDIYYGQSYWRSKEDILREFDTILAKDFTVLTTEEKLSLQDRRVAFLTPDQNDIAVNVRDGGE